MYCSIVNYHGTLILGFEIWTIDYDFYQVLQVQLGPRCAGQLNHIPGAYPLSSPPPSYVHNTHHYLTAGGQAETDRLTLFAADALAHHFGDV